MFKNIKIAQKLYLGFGIVLILMIFIAFVSYTRMQTISKQVAKRDLFASIETNISDTETNRILLFYTSKGEYRDLVMKSFEIIQDSLNIATKQYTAKEDQVLINDLTSKVKAYKSAFSSYAEAVNKNMKVYEAISAYGNEMSSAAKDIADPDFIYDFLTMRLSSLRFLYIKSEENYNFALETHKKTLAQAERLGAEKVVETLQKYTSGFVELHDSLNNLRETEKIMEDETVKVHDISTEIVKHEKEMLESTLDTAKMLVTILSLIALASGIFTSIIIARSISAPMNMAVLLSDKMANGDFTHEIDTNRNDEIGLFLQALNTMRIKLKEILDVIISSSGSVASGSTELASTTEQLSTTFSDQASQVSMVASATEELNVSSTQIMESVNMVKTQSEAGHELTITGQHLINDTNNAMLSIKANVEGLGETIASLAKSSEEIGSILLVINDIADQTNLLALNAAIEAARAGEHGRGFAVVADEVRKLAERTQTSIHDIEHIISSFVSETTKTNHEMTSAKQKVADGEAKLAETDEIFNRIVRAVQDISDSSNQIKTAIAEQVAAISNINDNAHIISSGLEESSAALTEVSVTVADLQEQADKQMETTNIFKI